MGDCVAKTGRSRLTVQDFSPPSANLSTVCPINQKLGNSSLRSLESRCTPSLNIPIYFVTESFEDAQRKMREFANTIPRSFVARYDPYTQRIEHLDSKRQVLKNMRQVRREMGILTDAMEKLS